MALCAQCGLQLLPGNGLCRHHPHSYGADWAKSNRVMCDFLHRKKVLARLASDERDDSFWTHANQRAAEATRGQRRREQRESSPRPGGRRKNSTSSGGRRSAP